MFTQAGADIALVRDPATGKFDAVIETTGGNLGNPQFEDTRAHAVLTTLMSHKRGQRPGDQVQGGGYYGDPQNRRGTLLWTVTQDRTITGSQLVAYAEDGGRQLAEMRLISGFTARALKLGPAKWRIECAWTLPDGSKGAVDLT